MTIYQLYAENGNRSGFWVQHRNWSGVCARIHSIDGHQSGRLPGKSPDYNQAPIRLDFFDVRSGRPMPADQFAKPPDDRNFTPIAEPSWYEPEFCE